MTQWKVYTPNVLVKKVKINRGDNLEVPLITIRNHHEGIISREIWDATQAEMHRRSQRFRRYSDVIYLDNNEIVDYQYLGEVFGSCGQNRENYIESDISYPMVFDERDGTVIVYAFEKENGFYFRNYKTKENRYTNKLQNVADMELINDNNDIAVSALSNYIGTLAVDPVQTRRGTGRVRRYLFRG